MLPEIFIKTIRCIIASVKKDEPAITYYDTVAGDGDCGETLLAGANGTNSYFKVAKLTDIFRSC